MRGIGIVKRKYFLPFIMINYMKNDFIASNKFLLLKIYDIRRKIEKAGV